MDASAFDRLARRIAAARISRRSALAGVGASALAAAGLASRAARAGAQEATPAAPNSSDSPDPLDALDADTRDSLARALWQTEIHAADLSPQALATLLDAKNSNAAFGLRMGTYIIDLMAAPPSFVAGEEARYSAILPYCQTLSPHQAYALSDLLGPESSQGYEPIPATANLVFPQANAMQLRMQLGWYFFVGSALAADGAEYGVELMFFRKALLPPAAAATFGLSDAENQVVEMHFAVSKAGDRHYQAKPIVLAGTSGQLSFASDRLGATLGRNTIRQLSDDSLFPIQLQAWGQDDGEDEPVPLAIDFTFTSGRDYLLQGADGCTPCCDGLGTLYYSIPNLQLDPASTLMVNGETVTLTGGTFWFDHQWGMLNGVGQSAVVRATENLQPAGPGGWDWFEAQFTGNRQITCAAPHSNDNRQFYFQTGQTPPGAMHVGVVGKYMDEAGATQSVTGSLAVTEWVRSVKSPAPIEYPPTNTWYPNRWEFQFGADVPEDIRTFVMTPIVSGGQSGYFAAGAQYAEGLVYLTDPAGSDIGRGFAESVSYADTLANQVRLAGLPVTVEMLALLGPQEPSELLKLASEAYVALHADELQKIAGTCIGLF